MDQKILVLIVWAGIVTISNIFLLFRVKYLSKRLDILVDAHNKMAGDYGNLIRQLIGDYGGSSGGFGSGDSIARSPFAQGGKTDA